MILQRSIVLAILLVAPSLALEHTNRTTLPSQLGPYPVHISTHELQTERDDPLAPSPRKRRLMLSIFQPLTSLTTCPDPSVEPYMPDLTTPVASTVLAGAGIPNGTISRLQISQCTSESDPAYPSPLPLLLFSTGAISPRLIYQTFASAIASGGYTVILMDHTYDAFAVEFPGAQTPADLAANNYPAGYANYTVAQRNEFLGQVATVVRSDDASSVLDAASSGSIPGLEAYCSSRRNGTGLRAGILGHSLGGATAASAVARDARFAAGLSLDGGVFRSDVRTAKPFVTLASESTVVDDPLSINGTVAAHYELLGGYKRWAYVRGTAHNAFCDYPVIVDAAGIRDLVPPELLAANSGEIRGPRIQRIVYEYVLDFFGMVLKGKEENLWGGSSEEFEEVQFLRSDG